MKFSIRNLDADGQYTATLYINGNPSIISAVIIDGAAQYKVISNANQLLSELDQITIKINTSIKWCFSISFNHYYIICFLS